MNPTWLVYRVQSYVSVGCASAGDAVARSSSVHKLISCFIFDTLLVVIFVPLSVGFCIHIGGMCMRYSASSANGSIVAP